MSVLVAGFGAFKGIEVIVRANQFILPLFVISFVFIFLLALWKVNLERLLPLLENGVQPIMLSSLLPASFIGEIVVLLMLLPSVNKPKEVRRKVLCAISAAVVFITLGTIFFVTVIGPNLSGHLLFPIWYLAKYINYENYIQRIEGFVFFFLLIAIVIKITLFYYLTCMATAQTLGLKTFHPVIFYIAPVQIAAATFLISNTVELQDIIAKYWAPFALLFEIVLPLLLLMVAVIRKKGHRRAACET